MRIRELLAVESIDLNAKAASKKEALDHAVASGRSSMWKATSSMRQVVPGWRDRKSVV